MAKRASLIEDGGAYFTPPSSFDRYSSGCCLLDCCLGGGWVENIVNLVGDKSSGKTLLACEAAANYLRKDGAEVWYREVEAAFDPAYIAQLGIPVDRFQMSAELFTVEDFFEDLGRLIEQGRRGLYILDSLDALSDRAELKRGLDEGTYGANKAKQIGQLFRRLNQKMSRSKITLMLISQVRDKIGVTFGEHHTRSGGRALDFYASQIVWLSQIKMLKRTVRGVERPIGIQVRAKVKKNKAGLPLREIDFPILFNYGVEDVLAGMQWLQEVKSVDVLGLDAGEVKRLSSFKGLGDMACEEYKMYRHLVSKAVRRVWKQVEATFMSKRRKY
jgi:recombination protein RecA